MALRESETTTSVTSVASARYTLRSTTSTSSLRNASPATSSFPLPMMVQSIPWKSSEQVLVITVSFL